MSKHGGNRRQLAEKAGLNEADILDFSANINPLGPPTWLRSLISRRIEDLVHYPDPECCLLRETWADKWNLSSEQILFGNGENELIFTVPRSLNCKRVITCPPCYIDYQYAAKQSGSEVITVPLTDFSPDWEKLNKTVRPGDLLFLGHPNNPTGNLLDKNAVLQFAAVNPSVFLFIDEAFVEFTGEENSFMHDLSPNMIIGRSFTKFYSIPGLRLGCIIADSSIIEKVKTKMIDWSVNTLAQEVGIRAAADDEFCSTSMNIVKKNKSRLMTELSNFTDLTVYPSEVNYLLCKITDRTAEELSGSLLKNHSIAIRDCSNYQNLDKHHFRVAVKADQDNIRLIEALKCSLLAKKSKVKKKTPSLMIQGTSSNAGKSILTAAFCRILMQDGVKVAPFKAQNMSLNSYVTRNGLEIGRAQVVQAQAARLDPDIRMNPILLKPNADMGTQVIINGKPIKNMVWRDYIKYKKEAGREVKKSYDSLAAEFEAVILEGAGSPGEVNLKKNDIVNMRMAEYAQAPVLITGDIDRGGIYASFVGTMEVLDQWERDLTAGFLVNRFRGDATLLDSAHDFVLNHTGKPVLGVIPYIHSLGLPEEDSVSFKEKANSGKNADIDIALIDLPRISNFTDVDPFDVEDDVQVRIVRSAHELGNPDCIIIPGSKSTVSDLKYLQSTGLANQIIEMAADGMQVFGICGGFQMLGQDICDPVNIESTEQPVSGLKILDVSTTMAQEKSLKRISLENHLEGYEIHHGETTVRSADAVTQSNGQVLCVSSGNIYGTYLHGIFDNDIYRNNFLNQIRKRKKLPERSITAYNLEPAFDRLAATVRSSVDMDCIYRLMGL